MKKLVMSLAALLFAVALLGVKPVLAGETIRLTNGEWQPFLSQHAPHNGFASHIVSEAFALAGIEVEYGFVPWKRSMKLARDGTWDGSAIWGTSPERLQQFHFTDAVVPTTYVFFHLKSTQFDWRRYEDLAKFKVGGTVEYFYSDDFEAAEKAGIFRTIRGRSDEVGLKNLLRGRIDVFPGELMVTYAQIRDTVAPKDAARFTHHKTVIVDKPMYVMLNKRLPRTARLRDAFNDGLRRLKQSGRYDEIVAAALAGKYAKRK